MLAFKIKKGKPLSIIMRMIAEYYYISISVFFGNYILFLQLGLYPFGCFSNSRYVQSNFCDDNKFWVYLTLALIFLLGTMLVKFLKKNMYVDFDMNSSTVYNPTTMTNQYFNILYPLISIMICTILFESDNRILGLWIHLHILLVIYVHEFFNIDYIPFTTAIIQCFYKIVILTITLGLLIQQYGSAKSIYGYDVFVSIVLILILTFLVYTNKRQKLKNVAIFLNYEYVGTKNSIKNVRDILYAINTLTISEKNTLFFRLFDFYIAHNNKKLSFEQQLEKIKHMLSTKEKSIEDKREEEKVFMAAITKLTNFYIQRICLRHISSEYLMLNYIYFLVHKTDKIFKSLNNFVNIKKEIEKQDAWILNFEVYKLEKLLVRNLIDKYKKEKAYKTINIIKFIEYNNYFLELQKNVSKCTQHTIDFWMNIDRFTPQIRKNNEIVDKILIYLKKIDDCVNKLLDTSGMVRIVKLLAGEFYEQVVYINSKARDIKKRISYENLHNYISIKDVEKGNYQLTERNRKAFIMVSGETANLGKILFTSPGIFSILNYTKEELYGVNIRNILPEFAKSDYFIEINNFIENKSRKAENCKYEIDFFFTKDKYLKICISNIKIYPSLTEGVNFLNILWPLNFNKTVKGGFMVVNKETFEIEGFNKGISELYNITAEMLYNAKSFGLEIFNLKQICPSLLSETVLKSLYEENDISAELYVDNLIRIYNEHYFMYNENSEMDSANRFNSQNDIPEMDKGIQVRVKLLASTMLDKKGLMLLKIDPFLTKADIVKEKTKKNVSITSSFQSSDCGSNLSKEANKAKKIKSWLKHYKLVTLPQNIRILRYSVILIMLFLIISLIIIVYMLFYNLNVIQNFAFGAYTLAYRQQSFVDTSNFINYLYNLLLGHPIMASSTFTVSQLQDLIKNNLVEQFQLQNHHNLLVMNITANLNSETINAESASILGKEFKFFEGEFLAYVDQSTTIPYTIQNYIYSFITNVKLFIDTSELKYYRYVSANFKQFTDLLNTLFDNYGEATVDILTVRRNFIFKYSYVAFGIIWTILLFLFYRISKMGNQLHSVFFLFSFLHKHEITDFAMKCKKFLVFSKNAHTKAENVTDNELTTIHNLTDTNIYNDLYIPTFTKNDEDDDEDKQILNAKIAYDKKSAEDKYRYIKTKTGFIEIVNLSIYVLFGFYLCTFFIFSILYLNDSRAKFKIQNEHMHNLGSMMTNLSLYQYNSYDYIFNKTCHDCEKESRRYSEDLYDDINRFNTLLKPVTQAFSNDYVKNLIEADTSICDYYILRNNMNITTCESNQMYFSGIRTLISKTLEDIRELKVSLNEFPAGYIFDDLNYFTYYTKLSLADLLKRSEETLYDHVKKQKLIPVLFSVFFVLGMLLLYFIIWDKLLRNLRQRLKQTEFYIGLLNADIVFNNDELEKKFEKFEFND